MLYDLILAFILTFLVRIYSVMAGGGRLALIPMLTVLLGMDPSVAVATMKCGGLSSSISLIKFHQHGKVKWDLWKKITPWMLLGVSLGTYLVINIDQELFAKFLSVSIAIALVALMFFKKKKELKHADEKIGIGVYFLSGLAGFFGALFGFKGMFMRYWYVSRGLTFIEATATNRATNFVGNLVSVISFSVVGLVNWPVAIVMFVAGGFGSWVGASLGIKLGSKWVERVFVVIVIIGAIMMFLQKTV